MSAETYEWLNTQTLIGFTNQRGHAWHYRKEDQGTEPNHYPGAIPVEDVNRRLFGFEIEDSDVYVKLPGSNPPQFHKAEGRKAMVTSDTHEILGVFKDGYRGHSYRGWLLDNVATILDDDLGIGSAGLLRNRAQAWASLEVPENITTPEGIEFRPNLVACTSFDGSLATTYKRTKTFVVCDNTLACSLGEQGQVFKVKHSKYSGMRLTDARAALAIVYTMADEFTAEIARLSAWRVEDSQFGRVLDVLVPVPDEDGRGKTVAENKRAEILNLYRNDQRCAPWAGTALGVLQTFNTHSQHYASVRKGALRQVRNMENVLTGKTEQADALVLSTLAVVA